MKKILLIFVTLLLLSFSDINAQTSWKGTVSTNWRTAANWTTGIPTSSVDAIIGDANFTGAFQPVLTGTTAVCKNLAIGTGSIASTLTISKNINVSGNITIGTNGTILHNLANQVITLRGNWINSGNYSATVSSALVTFSGTSQLITGTTTFKKVGINTGSTVTLANNISVNTDLSVTGTLDPTASFIVSGTGTLNVNSGGTILVKAANFNNNYSLSGTVTLNGKSTVNYASSLINQNISNAFTYGYLRASGGMTKYLTGNLIPLNSTGSTTGRIYVDAGTLDLQTFTADRGVGVVGGSVIIAIGATLRIGGTNSFPTNYITIAIASNSTVEYYGTNQTIKATTYGNLTFSSGSGVAIKTMPATTMTVASGLTSYAGMGTGVTFTAGANIIVNRAVNLDASSTFNGSTYSHTFKANWINNGIFNGNTSSVTFSGTNAVLSGTGTNNFNNLTFSAVGISGTATTSINVSGNLSTTGSGIFTHNSGGILTMTGGGKIISGNGLRLSTCIVSGTVTTSSNITVSGDITVNGSYTSTNGTMTLNGASNIIAGSGPVTFYSLNILGNISTSISFTLQANISVSLTGSFIATGGTATFNGNSALAGTANLFNITINGGKSLALGSKSVLGIANTFTKTGSLNVTTTVPNTVQYNSSGMQTVVNTTYHNLIIANAGTKTTAGNIIVNNDFTINSGVIFNASTFTFSLYRHFTNNGTFTSVTSTVQLLGSNAASITGNPTFNNLIVNKSTALTCITLLNNIITNNLTMTNGNMQTGINSVTITGTRTGAGIIIGTITHNHTFTNATAYYFEGPQNAITFTSPSASLTSVTVKVIIGLIPDFNPGQECVTREYDISIPAGTYTNATLRVHYEDNELNAFNEPNLTDYKYNSGTLWDSIGYTTKNTVSNYVERTGISTLSGRWALSGLRNVVRWNGSVSSAWENPANWTTISGVSMSNRVPSSTDDAQIGQSPFTNNPVINSSQTVNILRYGSAQSATLTISSGSLNAMGGTKGNWTALASHVLDVGAGSLIIGTNIDLSDGITGHDIMLKIGNGSATITYDLNQTASGGINFTGSGTLTIGGNYNYSSGSFTAGTGTVTYTGGTAQLVAPVTYYNLSFTKSTDRATINFPAVINGDLSTSTSGELAIVDTVSVKGAISIGAGTNFIEMGTRINIGGNWTNNGTFTVNHGTVNFNGTGNQSINATTFNTIMVNKASGTLSLTGNLMINNDLTISSGTVDLSTFQADRSNPGGNLTLGPASFLRMAGTGNFPNNFISQTIDPTSTIEYYGAIAQNVLDVNYGNLTFTNGAATPKSLLGNITVNGDLLINSGATLNPDSSNITLYGNFTNNGTYIPATSTLILNGVTKNFSGTTTVNDLDVLTGSYTITSGNLSIAGNLFIDAGGYFNFAGSNASLDGDLTNKGSLLSSGIVTFTGTRVQTFQLLNAVTSTSTGIINFNGTVAPVTNSTSSPSFATVNLNNTGGALTPSAPWKVFVACNIAPGVTFDGGPLTHTFYGNFTNNGNVISKGKLKFSPGAPFSAGSTVKLDAVGGSFTSTGKVEFGGTGSITIQANNPSLTIVDITNTNPVGVTSPDSWSIAQDMFIDSGATFNAGVLLNHIISGNLTNNGTLNGGTSTISFQGNPATINGLGTTNFNNLTVATGANVLLNQSINILGNFIDSANFDATGRTVTFLGTTPSIISGSVPAVTFDYLEQNKTASTTTLNLPVIVQGGLIMTEGILNSSVINLLTINNNATSTSGTSTSFVDGPMKKIGNNPFVFPVGNNSIWARIGISAPASATAEFQAQYHSVAYTNTSSITSPLTHVSKIEHWILDRTAGADSLQVTLYWENGPQSGIDNLGDVVVAHFNATNSWVNETQSGGVTGTVTAGTVTSQLISSFSPFTFGSSSVTVNPLPVELINVTAKYFGNAVQVNWSTATEKNNNYFTVEKSSDGANFIEVTKVKGAGNSSAILFYSAKDLAPYKGVSYYRIKQTDLNGDYSYSSVVEVSSEGQTSSNIIVYPNPVQNANITIEWNNIDENKINVTLYNSLGIQLLSDYYDLSQNKDKLLTVPMENISSGVYYLNIKGKTVLLNEKIIVK